MSQKYEALFSELDDALQAFIQEVDKKNLQDMATGEWNVKDVLGHITFWHQYYAGQYEALTENKKPLVFRSLAGKNEEGQKQMKRKSKAALVKDLLKAHESLRRCIVEKRIPSMKYMNSREYATDEFLGVVTGHINRHAVQVRRAKHIVERQKVI